MTTLARVHRANRGSHFRASRLQGGDITALIDPFLGVDHAWISAPTFPPHPHAGFSAVSYLFLDSETGIDNRDSLGNRTLIQPGGLHWTASGRGVVHEEVPAEGGKTVHMLQIFVNLQCERQGAAPFALSLAPQDVPVVRPPGVKIRVPLGQYGKTRSPLTPPTEVNLLDILLEDGAELILPVEASHNTFVMPIHGTLTIGGECFDSNRSEIPVFPVGPDSREFTIEARQGSAKAVVLSGFPLHQPVHWQGSMAMASPEALADAVAAYRRGEFGALPTLLD